MVEVLQIRSECAGEINEQFVRGGPLSWYLGGVDKFLMINQYRRNRVRTATEARSIVAWGCMHGLQRLQLSAGKDRNGCRQGPSERKASWFPSHEGDMRSEIRGHVWSSIIYGAVKHFMSSTLYSMPISLYFC